MIRVLHIFAPTFGITFSGDNKLWVRLFQKWSDEQVIHQIAFVEQVVIVDARTIKDAFGQKDRFDVFSFPSWRRALWAFKLLWLLILKMHSYDVLHVHTNYWGALLVGPLSKLLERPSIFQIVRMGVDDPSTLVSESLGHIKLWCFKRYDRILCVSEALRLECLRQGIGAGNAIMQINPVDADVFSPPRDGQKKLAIERKLHFPYDAKIILFIGSIIQRKGTDLLIDSFISLTGRYPDLYLVLVGSASKEEGGSVEEVYVEGLRQKIYDAGLMGRVLFTGRIDDDSILNEYYSLADVFAFPTRQEGLPNVLLEAMSAGLPIVATYLQGSTNLIIKDGETGFLIPLDDETVLTETLQSLLDNPQDSLKLGIAARVYAVQNFGFGNWQKNLISIYSSLLKEKSTGNR